MKPLEQRIKSYGGVCDPAGVPVSALRINIRIFLLLPLWFTVAEEVISQLRQEGVIQ